MTIDDLCRPIELILSDVDGVLTDGGITYDNEGIETKQFHVRDGLGIRLWQRAGHRFGIITARNSHIVKVRCAELGIDLVRQGCSEKLSTAKDIMQQFGLTPEQVCYIGDDLTDRPVIRLAGLGATVADASEEVLAEASLVTNKPGGHGAVRELIERILKAQGRWGELIQKY
jgi:3-deoxy-D-manno-octulosonate 8-phosphate phosphatase (KDO 8-P phosphatase)